MGDSVPGIELCRSMHLSQNPGHMGLLVTWRIRKEGQDIHMRNVFGPQSPS